MSTRFRSYQPEQMMLMPQDMREWVGEGHLAHHISDLVDGLDLRAFYARYEGDGRRKAPYEPRMMVKVLIYAYATGVFSSRGIARKLEEDVAFRMLAGGNFPQHRTICEFRRRHLKDFKKVFVEVVGLARELGLVRLGKVSIDGTKVRANASKRKAMSYERMGKEEGRLAGEIEELLRRAADEARGRSPGQDRNPKGGKPYKRGYGEPEAKAQSNFTDPESQIMKTSAEGFQQCYNAQVAVDGERQLVVATELTANGSDQGKMLALVDEVEATFKKQPDTVLADAGYSNERDLRELEARGIDGYVASGREGKKRVAANPEKHPATHRMAEKLATVAGREMYRARKWLSEAPNGWIKQVLGFRRFSVRGLRKAQGEWNLVCLALNVKRLQPMMAR